MPRTLIDEWNQDDWDGQDWTDSTTHIRSERVEEPSLERANNSEDAGLNEEGYALNWRHISDKKRASCNYTCEVCSVNLHDNLRLLHVHHLDRDKTNNDDNNLQVLCAICHSIPEDHQHLRERISPTERAFVLLRRKMQQGKPDVRKNKRRKTELVSETPVENQKPPPDVPPLPLEAAKNTGRTDTFFLGHRLVANFWKGQFQGRAESLITKKKISLVGTSIDDVMTKLCIEVKQLHGEMKKERRALLPERHRQYVMNRKVEYKGVRPPGTTRHRTDTCYGCKAPVDNAVDSECVSCGWIICSNCASCGCGYSSYR